MYTGVFETNNVSILLVYYSYYWHGPILFFPDYTTTVPSSQYTLQLEVYPQKLPLNNKDLCIGNQVLNEEMLAIVTQSSTLVFSNFI